MEDLILILDQESDLDLVLDSQADLEFEIDAAVIKNYEKYEGTYEVIPILYDDQVLETKKKVMMDDVTVKPIPVVSTTNPYGGQTVVIG